MLQRKSKATARAVLVTLTDAVMLSALCLRQFLPAALWSLLLIPLYVSIASGNPMSDIGEELNAQGLRLENITQTPAPVQNYMYDISNPKCSFYPEQSLPLHVPGLLFNEYDCFEARLSLFSAVKRTEAFLAGNRERMPKVPFIRGLQELPQRFRFRTCTIVLIRTDQIPRQELPSQPLAGPLTFNNLDPYVWYDMAERVYMDCLKSSTESGPPKLGHVSFGAILPPGTLGANGLVSTKPTKNAEVTLMYLATGSQTDFNLPMDPELA